MKRTLVVTLVLFGIGLLFHMANPWRPIPGGKMRWSPLTQETTIHITSRNAVINVTELDLSKTRFVRAHPDGKILVRVTGGNPTILKERLPEGVDGIFVINPVGLIAGNDVSPERMAVSDSDLPIGSLPSDAFLDVRRASEVTWIPQIRSQGSVAEVKAHGNVYALAIKGEGSVRATKLRVKGGGRIPSAESAERE